MAFQSLEFKHTWWGLYRKHVCTIYVFIITKQNCQCTVSILIINMHGIHTRIWKFLPVCCLYFMVYFYSSKQNSCQHTPQVRLHNMIFVRFPNDFASAAQVNWMIRFSISSSLLFSWYHSHKQHFVFILYDFCLKKNCDWKSDEIASCDCT